MVGQFERLALKNAYYHTQSITSPSLMHETGAYYTEQISQKEKHKYSILMHIYGIQKGRNDHPICETAKETQMYRNLLDSVGEGEGGMI